MHCWVGLGGLYEHDCRQVVAHVASWSCGSRRLEERSLRNGVVYGSYDTMDLEIITEAWLEGREKCSINSRSTRPLAFREVINQKYAQTLSSILGHYSRPPGLFFITTFPHPHHALQSRNVDFRPTLDSFQRMTIRPIHWPIRILRLSSWISAMAIWA